MKHTVGSEIGDPLQPSGRGMHVSQRMDMMSIRDLRLAELLARFAERWDELGAYERDRFAVALAAMLDLLEASGERR